MYRGRGNWTKDRKKKCKEEKKEQKEENVRRTEK
jgi:hypothetical protein